MSKKLITACLGVLALAAFALPTAASASPVVTHPTGTVLNPENGECTGVKKTICITGTNVSANTVFYNGANVELLDCSKAVFTGYLRKNKENHIEGDIHTATFTGTGTQDPEEPKNMPECTGTNGLPNTTVTSNGTDPLNVTKIDEEDVLNGSPYCVTAGGSLAADEFTLRGGTCSETARAIVFVLKPTGLAACKYSRAAAITGTYTTDTTGDAILSVTPAVTNEFEKVEGGILCPQKGRLGMSITMETDKTTAEPLYIS